MSKIAKKISHLELTLVHRLEEIWFAELEAPAVTEDLIQRTEGLKEDLILRSLAKRSRKDTERRNK